MMSSPHGLTEMLFKCLVNHKFDITRWLRSLDGSARVLTELVLHQSFSSDSSIGNLHIDSAFKPTDQIGHIIGRSFLLMSC